MAKTGIKLNEIGECEATIGGAINRVGQMFHQAGITSLMTFCDATMGENIADFANGNDRAPCLGCVIQQGWVGRHHRVIAAVFSALKCAYATRKGPRDHPPYPHRVQLRGDPFAEVIETL